MKRECRHPYTPLFTHCCIVFLFFIQCWWGYFCHRYCPWESCILPACPGPISSPSRVWDLLGPTRVHGPIALMSAKVSSQPNWVTVTFITFLSYRMTRFVCIMVARWSKTHDAVSLKFRSSLFSTMYTSLRAKLPPKSLSEMAPWSPNTGDMGSNPTQGIWDIWNRNIHHLTVCDVNEIVLCQQCSAVWLFVFIEKTIVNCVCYKMSK